MKWKMNMILNSQEQKKKSQLLQPSPRDLCTDLCIETHKNKVDDNTANENLHEHDEKEEAITNNNEIVDIPQVQIEVIEGIELNGIDWNNVEYVYAPEIVEKPTDTDPIQASCNQLDQAEAIEEPILEEIVDQNPEDNETNNCEISDQDSSTVLTRTSLISKSPLKTSSKEFTCHHCIITDCTVILGPETRGLKHLCRVFSKYKLTLVLNHSTTVKAS